MRYHASILCAIVFFALMESGFAQGIYLPAVGPVNRAMGGASVAAPLDATGALYRNPATMAALPSSQLDMSVGLLLADYEVASEIPGLGAGVTGGEPGANPLVNGAWVHQMPNDRLRFGFGFNTAAGYFANSPVDATNPILAPPPVGFGRFSGSAQFFQMTPALSYLVSDRLSVGVSPILSMGLFTSNFSPFVPPNADGRYPSGNGTRFSWGGGVQLGAFYIHNSCWRFGASLRSPIWHEPFRYHAEDENGLPTVNETRFDLPLVASLGLSYSPDACTLIAFDTRFTDNQNAAGFGDAAQFQPDGSIGGLGWNSQMSFAIGLQRKITQRFYARFGYMYATRLIDGPEAAINASGTNLAYRHLPSCGASIRLADHVSISFAYSYSPKATISGPIYLPDNTPIPGSEASNQMAAHAAEFGVSVSY